MAWHEEYKDAYGVIPFVLSLSKHTQLSPRPECGERPG